MKKSLLAVSFCLMATMCVGQNHPTFREELFIQQDDTLRYRILYPRNYNEKKRYPLLVFLHGAGERGTDNEAQLRHGAWLFEDSLNRKKFPAIVVFPQCAPDDYWPRILVAQERTDTSPRKISYLADIPPGKSLQMSSLLVDSLAASGHVDENRMYIGGLSMGAMGTFEMLWRKPGFFAAAVTICGGANTEKACTYPKNFPIWIFHGAKDDVVNVEDSRLIAEALQSCGAKVKYTEYPEAGHNSWDNAFAEPELLPWLFIQKKKN